MRLKTAFMSLLGVVVIAPVLAFLVVRWHQMASPAPHTNFTEFGRYVTALNLSHDPVAAKIRAQVSDGPTALAHERAAAQAAGIDLDPAHLQKPLPASDQNAAMLYDRWSKLRRKTKMQLSSYADPMQARYAYTPQQIARVQKILDDHPDVFALIRQAADCPRCVWTVDWQKIPKAAQKPPAYSPDTYLLWDAGSNLREAACEISTESFLLALKGRYAEAIADQTRGFRIAQQEAAEPTLTGTVCSGAVEAITLKGMSNILELAGPNPEVASLVRQTIAAHPFRSSLKQALAGEAALMPLKMSGVRVMTPVQLAGYLLPQGDASSLADDPSIPSDFSPDEKRFFLNAVDAAEAEELSHLRRLYTVSGTPRGALRRFKIELDEVNAWKPDPEKQPNLVSALDADLYEDDSDFIEACDYIDLNQTEEQILMAAAEVLEAKGRMAVLPSHLIGHHPDPFHTGQSLHCRREGANGFVVYTVGSTGHFDGGKPGGKVSKWYNLLFRYPGAAKMAVPPDMLK